MHLAGAVVDARGTSVGVPLRDRVVVGHSGSAVHLQRTIQDAAEGLGDEGLEHRDLLPRVLTAVDLPGRVQHHQP